MIKESLSKPHKFTDFVNFKNVADKKGKRRTLRQTGKTLGKGIYQLYLPQFHIIYVGISHTDNKKGISNRFYAHAQKLTGKFKGAKDTTEFARFREIAVTKGYDLDTILDHVLVYFIPCDKMKTREIEAWETIIFNTLKSRNQCILNSAKRMELLNDDTLSFILKQEYLK